jgi:hypothetical protein
VHVALYATVGSINALSLDTRVLLYRFSFRLQNKTPLFAKGQPVRLSPLLAALRYVWKRRSHVRRHFVNSPGRLCDILATIAFFSTANVVIDLIRQILLALSIGIQLRLGHGSRMCDIG